MLLGAYRLLSPRTHASLSLQSSKQQNSAPNSASTILACEYSVQLQLLVGPSSFDCAVLPETDTSHHRMLSLLEVLLKVTQGAYHLRSPRTHASLSLQSSKQQNSALKSASIVLADAGSPCGIL